jgi:hypothetical protein
MINEQLELLGLQAEDKVTGFKGIVTSISFDLYGCVQALINPGFDKGKGEMKSSLWLDTNRLQIISEIPVMQQPDFEKEKGPEVKPIF